MSVYKGSIRLLFGLVAAFVLTVGADKVFADSCSRPCGCGVILECVGGAGCTCSTFNFTVWDCGLMDNGGGCSVTCGTNTTTLCCSDYCPQNN